MKTIRVTAAVIRKGDRVFATARGYGDYKGGWEFPGGKIEPGETPQEALEQARTKEYGNPWLDRDLPVFHVGVNYDPKKRGIDDPLVEPAGGGKAETAR